MIVSSGREMNDSLAITASSLAITEKKPQRPGGCVGIFFQLFDWNRRFAKKKLFPTKLLSPARLRQASKKFGGDEKQPKHRLIANENSGGFPNAKNSGTTNSRCESKREMKAPSLVARLMGLESMPGGPGGKAKKASASEIGSKMVEKLDGRRGGSDKEAMDLEKAEIKSELRPQKLQKIGMSERRPVSRFSAEALQLRTVLSRPRKHQPKLTSPVKSPRNVSGRNAARLIGAATRILEPGLQKSRAKCALTYPKYFSPLEDKANLALHHLEGTNPYVDSKTLEARASMPSCENCGYLLHSKNGTTNVEEHSSSVSSPVSSYSESSCQGPGRNMPRFAIFSSRDQLEGVSECSSSNATAEIDDVSYCAELILGKRRISRGRMEKHGTGQGSNVKKDASSVNHVLKQKQNETSQNRDRGLMKSKPSSLQSNRVLSAAESMNNTKNFVAQNRRIGASTRLRMPATADGCKFETERKPYLRRSDSLPPVRKKRLMNVSRQGESSSFVNATLGRESRPCSVKPSRKDVVFPISSVDNHSTKPRLPCLREKGATNNSPEGSNVVSFTFKSAMKQKAGIYPEVTKRKSQNSSSFEASPGRSFFKGNEEAPCLQKSFPLKGDILGALLEQKLKELTSEEEFAEGGTAPRKSTATILQELITALNAERQFHLDSLPVRPSRTEDLCDDGDVSTGNTCMNFQATPDAASDLVGNSLDSDHCSPGCVLEATFSTDSYLSSSPNCSSKDKVLAESVDSTYDESLFPAPGRDLSDCATSLFPSRSCRALITDHVNNISGVLSKIDQLRGSKLSYTKEVILNTELILGTTPEQQALPVDDGFSVSHFLLNELEMLSSLLWMTFGQLLGCNDPKQMNQLKGFAFDCILEYLDSKIGRYSDSGFRTWTKLPSSMTKEILIADIIEEVKEWTEFVGLIPDELVEWDMSRSLGKWTDFDIEEFECGTEVDRHILQVLVDEVVKVIPLDRGQHVKLKPDVKEPRFGWRGHAHDSIGTVLCVDDDGVLRVGFPGASRGWKADPAEMERVEEFKVGDWVRIRPTLTTAKHGFGSATPGSIGVVYCIRPDNSLMVELSYLPHPWHCEPEEVEPVEPFRIADRVCVKRTVAEPRYAWGGETHHSVGKIIDIEADGLLIIEIPNRPIPWQADPSDMEKVEDFKVGDWVRVKASVPSPKYGWEDITRNSVGIIHSLEEDGDVGIAFCFRSKPFSCSVTDVEKVPPFEVGQEIHVLPSVSQPRLGWSNETPATVGKIVRIDMDGALNVRVAGRDSLWKVSPGDAERLSGLEVGDWVRSKPSLGTRPSYDWYSIGKESLAVVHSVQDTGYLELACCFRKGRLMTHYTDVEKVSGFQIGQHVRFRSGLVEPRWGWRGTNPDSRGVITGVNADGEVRVAFFGLQCLWKGDPADLEIEPTFDVGEWVKLREIASVWKSIGPGSIGVVQGLSYEDDKWDGSVFVAFCGEQDQWVGYCSHLEKVNKLLVGQRVRVRNSVKQPRFGWSGHSHASVGTISAIDADGKLRIYTPAGSRSWMLDPSEVDLVEEKEIQVGDWVKVRENVSNPTHQWGDVSHASIGVVHRIEDGDLWVAFCFMDRLWLCKALEMERIRAFKIGDKVKIRDGLVAPRWGWGMETHASRGEVVGVDANGKLRIKFQWREGRPWIGDPADIVLLEHDE